MRVPCLRAIIAFVLWLLWQPFCRTSRSPRCSRPQLGGRIQFSPHFTSVTFPICWIPVTLLGALLRGARFNLSTALRFASFSCFSLPCPWSFSFYVGIARYPFGTVSIKSDATYFLILCTIFVWMPLSVLLALLF